MGDAVDGLCYLTGVLATQMAAVMHRDHVAVVAAEVGEVSLVLGFAVGSTAGGAEVTILIRWVPEAFALVQGWDWVAASVGLGAGETEIVGGGRRGNIEALPGTSDAVDADPEVVAVMGVAKCRSLASSLGD